MEVKALGYAFRRMTQNYCRLALEFTAARICQGKTETLQAVLPRLGTA